MKFLLVVLAIAVVVSAYKLPTEQDYQNEFVEFMQKYQKTYAAEEFQTRYGIFKRNLDYINEHNTKDLGFSTRMNAFGDLTADEFGKTFNGLRMNNIPMTQLINPEEAAARIQALPTSKDWRTAGAVTAIKNQGQCGSCWSFSATGSTEGAHFLAGNTLVGLSEQNLVDCSTSEGNMGCNGGLMDYAFEYIIKNKGIDTEASYPYQAQGPLTCRFKSADIGATISSYKDVTSGDESKLQEAVNKAPVSVAIDASHSSFQFYSSGVYYEPACSSTQLDHGVLAIGWGVESSKDYWLVKNSWGTDWGLSGYIHMSRNRNNNCGIATTASYPEV